MSRIRYEMRYLKKNDFTGNKMKLTHSLMNDVEAPGSRTTNVLLACKQQEHYAETLASSTYTTDRPPKAVTHTQTMARKIGKRHRKLAHEREERLVDAAETWNLRYALLCILDSQCECICPLE